MIHEKKLKELKDELKRLRHFKSIVTGLWVTDRPEKIFNSVKDKYFWKIDFS